MHLSVKPTSKRGLPIRAVEDYHVDRTDVEAGQPVELTVTNCSIGLNSQPVQCFRALTDTHSVKFVVLIVKDLTCDFVQT